MSDAFGNASGLPQECGFDPKWHIAYYIRAIPAAEILAIWEEMDAENWGTEDWYDA